MHMTHGTWRISAGQVGINNNPLSGARSLLSPLACTCACDVWHVHVHVGRHQQQPALGRALDPLTVCRAQALRVWLALWARRLAAVFDTQDADLHIAAARGGASDAGAAAPRRRRRLPRRRPHRSHLATRRRAARDLATARRGRRRPCAPPAVKAPRALGKLGWRAGPW